LDKLNLAVCTPSLLVTSMKNIFAILPVPEEKIN